MAPYAFRLRRAVALSSSIFHHSLRCPPTHSILRPTANLIPGNPLNSSSIVGPPSRFFTSTTISLSSRNRPFDGNTDEINEHTILFEGCDYNHWLIVIDFPKDPEPSREEMISFYEQTATKIFGSLEEAKKRIYACSTTTYKGFQVECSEETSEKFKDLPGVIFVLPDSYIDPVNKEYGGDKYINGEIIPRPPPVQYARQGPSGKFRSRQSPRGPMQGDTRNYGPPHASPPQQNFGQPPSPQQNYGMPPPQKNYGQPPPPQQNFGIRPPQLNYGPVHPSQQNYGPPENSPPQQNYAPPGPGERRGPTPNSNVPGGWNNSQGGRGNQMSSYQSNYNQGDHGERSFQHVDQRSFPQGGSLGQAPPGAQEPVMGTAYSQNNPADQRNATQGSGQTNYAAVGNADRGRY